MLNKTAIFMDVVSKRILYHCSIGMVELKLIMILAKLATKVWKCHLYVTVNLVFSFDFIVVVKQGCLF